MTVDGMSFDFDSLLKESVKIHGHICPGQVLGVRWKGHVHNVR